MAMIQCPECKKSISSDAQACPKCGKPLDDAARAKAIQEAKTAKKVGLVIGLALMAAIGWCSLQGGKKSVDTPAAKPAASTPAPQAQAGKKGFAAVQASDLRKDRRVAQVKDWEAQFDAHCAYMREAYQVDQEADRKFGVTPSEPRTKWVAGRKGELAEKYFAGTNATAVGAVASSEEWSRYCPR